MVVMAVAALTPRTTLGKLAGVGLAGLVALAE
jgi:hypothetical protein